MEYRPNAAEAMVRGWCPSAWRPMMAGDGLLVRVRPALSRMTREQARGLCDAAMRFGNGAIDLTNRAGLQMRGVTEGGLPGLLERLVALDLVSSDPAVEARPAILTAPDWKPGDATERVAQHLLTRLDAFPELPGKVGFAVDLSGAPVLTHVSADFRVERTDEGGMIVRADGREGGAVVDEEGAVERLLDLARWFVASGGAAAGRMARHAAKLPDGLSASIVAGTPREFLADHANDDRIYGAPFGRMAAEHLIALLQDSEASALRITPWRRIILEDGRRIAAEGFTLGQSDGVMLADACVGAPACTQATVSTRELACALAGHISGSLHISGCAKGCARRAKADVVLTGRGGHFDLAFNARAGDPPIRSGLNSQQIYSLLGPI